MVNVILINLILNLFSLKKIFKIIVWVFIFVLSLPIFAVLILANAGIPAVSNKLASVNAKTHTIEIHDPTGRLLRPKDDRAF